jgi:glucosamine-6-phosphate deaminase
VDIRVYRDYHEMSRAAAQIIADQIRSKPDSVLGLATGSTPEGMYAELVKMYREGKVDFSKATSFNLDEYVGMDPSDPRSYHRFMRVNLFDHVNFAPGKTHVPSGIGDNLDEQAMEYERMIAAAGGIDLQVLGIGMNGHIGFNEPGSPFDSRTRVVDLSEQTVSVNREKTEAESLPTQAVSMGMGTILQSRRIMLLANGAGKAEIVSRAFKGPITTDVPASVLQRHPDVIVILDAPAARLLDSK